MTDLVNIIPAFLLIVVRITGFFATVPIFSYKTIPSIHKIGLSLILSFFVLTIIPVPEIEVNGYYILYVLKELFVGLSIGFVASIVLYALQVAGGFIDLQMGFAIANVFDPQTGIQSPLMGRFLYILAIMFLLTIDAHHMLLNGIFQSYELVPIEGWKLSFGQLGIAPLIVKTVSQMFYIAFQMAIPVVGCLFLVDLALGIISRTVPQVNVFIVGLPLKVGVSFIIILLITPMIFELVQGLYGDMISSMRKMMELLGGP